MLHNGCAGASGAFFKIIGFSVGYKHFWYIPSVINLTQWFIRSALQKFLRKNLKKFYKDIKKVVRDNNYDYVLRMSQFSISALDLLAAKQGGATHLIMRSTNSQITGGTATARKKWL